MTQTQHFAPGVGVGHHAHQLLFERMGWSSRGYKAKHVEDQSHLDRLILYVHLNPVKAGLVSDSAEYSFAGHREVKREIRAPMVDIDEMLLCFGETKGKDLATVLNKNPDVVSWWVGEGIRRRLEDEEFAAELVRLDRELSALLTGNER